MTKRPILRLKKHEHKRIRAGHPWVYSNEVDVSISKLNSFQPGDCVIVEAQDQTPLGSAYINPHSLITARIFSPHPNDVLDSDFFIKAISSALQVRDQVFRDPFYRLAFGESDGLPGLVIDRFDNDIAIQINTYGMERCKSIIIDALLHCLPNTRSILFKNDSTSRIQEGLPQEVIPAFGTPPEMITIKENDCHFQAPFATGQKTGWFYDHRQNRARLTSYVKNRHVLDVFSYVGSWGIQTAYHGASSVTCLDASKLALEHVRQNASLNALSERVTTLCDDAFNALKELSREPRRFDVIILDPPAFIKRAKDKKEGMLAYQRINELALRLLSPGGILISCSCSMHLSMQELMEILQRISIKTGERLQLLERGHQGPDHPIHLAIPETDYLKALFIRKLP